MRVALALEEVVVMMAVEVFMEQREGLVEKIQMVVVRPQPKEELGVPILLEKGQVQTLTVHPVLMDVEMGAVAHP